MLGLQVSISLLSKIFRLTRTGGRLKFVHYIRMEYFGFIDVLPTVHAARTLVLDLLFEINQPYKTLGLKRSQKSYSTMRKEGI